MTSRTHRPYFSCIALLALSVALAASVAIAGPSDRGAAAGNKTTPSKAQKRNAALLIEAADENQLARVRQLIKSGADINAAQSGDGTALMVAAKQGNLSMVSALLALGADVNRTSLGDGNALIAAARAGHLEVVKRLIAAGAKVDASVVGDETPLINASRRGRLDVVQQLIASGANVNLGVRTEYGEWRSPLNQAKNRDLKRLLLAEGAVADRQ